MRRASCAQAGELTPTPAMMLRIDSAPIVVDEKVIFAPRDCAGVFALDRETGRLVWDRPLAPSDELVGFVQYLGKSLARD